MHLFPTLLLLHSLATTSLALDQTYDSTYHKRSLETLVEPEEPAPASKSSILPHDLDLHNLLPDSSFFRKLDLRNAAEMVPFFKDLRKRATTPATGAAAPATNPDTNAAGAQAQQPAAGANAQQQAAPANAQQAAAGTADDTGAAAQQPVAPAVQPNVAAPVAGGGGGAGPAPAQPPANAQATLAITQKFTAASAPPAVQTGTIGLGTLTGKIGVVKTNDAKNEGLTGREAMGVRWSILGVLASWFLAMGVGGVSFGLGLI